MQAKRERWSAFKAINSFDQSFTPETLKEMHIQWGNYMYCTSAHSQSHKKGAIMNIGKVLEMCDIITLILYVMVKSMKER